MGLTRVSTIEDLNVAKTIFSLRPSGIDRNTPVMPKLLADSLFSENNVLSMRLKSMLTQFSLADFKVIDQPGSGIRPSFHAFRKLLMIPVADHNGFIRELSTTVFPALKKKGFFERSAVESLAAIHLTISAALADREVKAALSRMKENRGEDIEVKLLNLITNHISAERHHRYDFYTHGLEIVEI